MGSDQWPLKPIFEFFLPHFARLAPPVAIATLFNVTLGKDFAAKSSPLMRALENTELLARIDAGMISVEFVSQRINSEFMGESKYLSALLQLLPVHERRSIVTPEYCARDHALLRLAIDLNLKLSHRVLVSLFEAPPSALREEMWNLYLETYPAAHLRSSGFNLAVQKCLVSLVKDFLAAGIDINALDESGNTALHFLGKSFSPELLPLLISRGAIIDRVNEGGVTPLLALVQSNADLRYVPQLVEYGADILAVTSNKFNVFTIEASLQWTSVLPPSRLPPLSPEFLRTCSPDGSHLLSFLVNENRISGIANLLVRFPDRDWDLLNLPVLLRFPDLSQVIIKYVCSGPFTTKYAPVVLPIILDRLSFHKPTHAETLEIIAHCGKDVDRVGPSGCTALLEACAAGSSTIIRSLLQLGADPCQRSPSGETSLIMLAKSSSRAFEDAEQAVEELIASIRKSPLADSCLAAQDGADRTALTLCVQLENIQSLRALLKTTEWSLDAAAPLAALLFGSVPFPRSLETVLTHLKTSLTPSNFEKAMKLEVDNVNLLQRACLFKSASCILKILEAVPFAYGKEQIEKAQKIAGVCPAPAPPSPLASSSSDFHPSNTLFNPFQAGELSIRFPFLASAQLAARPAAYPTSADDQQAPAPTWNEGSKGVSAFRSRARKDGAQAVAESEERSISSRFYRPDGKKATAPPIDQNPFALASSDPIANPFMNLTLTQRQPPGPQTE